MHYKRRQLQIEAADVLLRLAQTINQREPGSKEAERLAFEALSLRQQFEAAPDKVQALPVNALVDNRSPGGEEDPYTVLAVISSARKETSKELKYYQLARKRLATILGIAAANHATLETVRLLKELHRQNEALKIMVDFENELAAQTGDYRNSLGLMTAFANTITWAIDNQKYQLAKKAIKDGLNFESLANQGLNSGAKEVMQYRKQTFLSTMQQIKDK
ncbi:MAG: hypothetical protein K2X81_22465 [Candidatus Obscuribacterales bacterium]|nr:hypothetical protein [Candidatus Obscuribacterales bacterium]